MAELKCIFLTTEEAWILSEIVDDAIIRMLADWNVNADTGVEKSDKWKCKYDRDKASDIGAFTDSLINELRALGQKLLDASAAE